MRAQDALRTALREQLALVARQHGYKGSPPNWRKSSAAGDWAVVNVQSSSFSSAEHLRCIVNLAFVPEPWLRWEAEWLGAGMPKSVSESLGLYRERLHPDGTPDGTDGWWDVSDDESARVAVADMLMQLGRSGWPVLDDMFSRDVMMTRLNEGDLGLIRRSSHGVFFARAEALLLMDAGHSAALDSVLEYAMKNVTPTQQEHARKFDEWVRGQAAKAR